MILRRFNKTGINAFSGVLAEFRQTPDMELPVELLENDEFTTVIEPEIEVDERQFENRREAAEYLDALLEPLNEAEVTFDAGLWTWLTLFFFDQVCPQQEGKRIVKNNYYYVFEPRNQLYFYRHLLFIAWRIIVSSPNVNRLLLDTPLSSLGQFADQVMKRLYLTRIPCIFEVLDRLYWDPTQNAPRRGILGGTRPGDLKNRFPICIRQLEMTYDLQSLNADQLIELLGAEFNFNEQPALVAARHRKHSPTQKVCVPPNYDEMTEPIIQAPGRRPR